MSRTRVFRCTKERRDKLPKMPLLYELLGTGDQVMEQLVTMIAAEVARMAADYAALLAAARIGG